MEAKLMTPEQILLAEDHQNEMLLQDVEKLARRQETQAMLAMLGYAIVGIVLAIHFDGSTIDSENLVVGCLGAAVGLCAGWFRFTRLQLQAQATRLVCRKAANL